MATKVLGLFAGHRYQRRKRMEDLFEEKELMRLTLQSIGDAVCAATRRAKSHLNPVAQRPDRLAGV